MSAQAATRAHAQKKKFPLAKVKGSWSADEDGLLVGLVQKMGEGNWSPIARALNAATGKDDTCGRIGKQCRERWNHHLKPGINKLAWTSQEEELLVQAHKVFGNRWSEIAKHIPGRSENAVKNHWNATLRRRDVHDPSPGPLKLYCQQQHTTPGEGRGKPATMKGTSSASSRRGGALTRPAPRRTQEDFSDGGSTTPEDCDEDEDSGGGLPMGTAGAGTAAAAAAAATSHSQQLHGSSLFGLPGLGMGMGSGPLLAQHWGSPASANLAQLNASSAFAHLPLPLPSPSSCQNSSSSAAQLQGRGMPPGRMPPFTASPLPHLTAQHAQHAQRAQRAALLPRLQAAPTAPPAPGATIFSGSMHAQKQQEEQHEHTQPHLPSSSDPFLTLNASAPLPFSCPPWAWHVGSLPESKDPGHAQQHHATPHHHAPALRPCWSESALSHARTHLPPSAHHHHHHQQQQYGWDFGSHTPGSPLPQIHPPLTRSFSCNIRHEQHHDHDQLREEVSGLHPFKKCRSDAGPLCRLPEREQIDEGGEPWLASAAQAVITNAGDDDEAAGDASEVMAVSAEEGCGGAALDVEGIWRSVISTEDPCAGELPQDLEPDGADDMAALISQAAAPCSAGPHVPLSGSNSANTPPEDRPPSGFLHRRVISEAGPPTAALPPSPSTTAAGQPHTSSPSSDDTLAFLLASDSSCAAQHHTQFRGGASAAAAGAGAAAGPVTAPPSPDKQQGSPGGQGAPYVGPLGHAVCAAPYGQHSSDGSSHSGCDVGGSAHATSDSDGSGVPRAGASECGHLCCRASKEGCHVVVQTQPLPQMDELLHMLRASSSPPHQGHDVHMAHSACTKCCSDTACPAPATLSLGSKGPIRVCLPALSECLQRLQQQQHHQQSHHQQQSQQQQSQQHHHQQSQHQVCSTGAAVEGLCECLLSICVAAMAGVPVTSVEPVESGERQLGESGPCTNMPADEPVPTAVGVCEPRFTQPQAGDPGGDQQLVHTRHRAVSSSSSPPPLETAAAAAGIERSEQEGGRGGVDGIVVAVRLGTDTEPHEHSVLLGIVAHSQAEGERVASVCAKEMGALFC